MRQGDRSEFTVFYESSRDACLRAVTAVVGDQRIAEEVVADAFGKAWAQWSKVRRHPAPRAWVLRTALNASVSRWRRHRREQPLTVDNDVADSTRDDGVDGALLSALRALPKRQREVIVLRVFLDLDTETTGNVLNIAPGTVTAHLSRAIGTLRRTISPTHTLEGQQ